MEKAYCQWSLFFFFLIGSGSLVALPLSSGWYSKEAIILGCVNKNICIMLVFAVWMAAILTSLYSTQIFYRVFVKGAKEAGLEGESIEEERMSTGNKMQSQFICTVCTSLFLLGNFANWCVFSKNMQFGICEWL